MSSRSLSTKVLTPFEGEAARVLSFFSPILAGDILKARSYDLTVELNRLLDLAEDLDPKVSLAAMKQVRAVMTTIAEMNGAFVSVSETQESPSASSSRRRDLVIPVELTSEHPTALFAPPSVVDPA